LKISQKEIVGLLKDLIRIPSYSGEETGTADHLQDYLQLKGLQVQRLHNNLFLKNNSFDPAKKTILLNSHLDTVRVNEGWSHDPFDPIIEGDRLFGLGSNDAGGALVSLLATFLYYCDQQDLKYNLIFLASAEEEISGKKGVESALPRLGPICFGIVGEPTRMRLAIAEKGLMVLDCKTKGKSGHAAREEGSNAIYDAINDIDWIRNYRFPVRSELLGEVKMTVTMINAGTQHNVIPDECHFVVDIRSTDLYTNEQILELVRKNLKSEVKPRSTRLQSSSIEKGHAVVREAQSLGIELFGSSTLSDQALMPFPTVKIGPGDSARSHTPDEFVGMDEIESGVETYINLLDRIIL
jgi:acetylornithine deacetylase